MNAKRYFVSEQNSARFRVIAEHSLPPKRDEGLGSPLWTLVREFPAGAEFKMEAEALAAQLNAEERLRVLAQPVTRYMTRWYVSIDPDAAKRHAEIDHTPIDKIRIMPNLQVIYNCSSWILWSDGKVTNGSGFPLVKGGNLSQAAVSLIGAVHGADAGHVHLPGGIAALANVKNVIGVENVTLGPSRGVYASECIEAHHVEWLDGTRSYLYAHTAGYFEGYMFNIYPTLEQAASAMGCAPGPEGIYEFSDEQYTYDPVLGFVAHQDNK